jgi:putative DNA primase/helicase
VVLSLFPTPSSFLQESSLGKEPDIKCFRDLKLEKLTWLWPNRIPLGKLSLIVGDPGIGKSFLSLYMAAQVSTGRSWVDTFGSTSPASVLILTAEDDLADTVGVRLAAAEADLSRIHYINAVKTPEREYGLYNLTKDFDILIKTVRDIPNIKLVIIDPISAYMEGKNENKNAEVREYLNPLAELARMANIAIVGISHLNKNQTTQTAAYRVLGSIGFTATVRAVWLVHQDPNDETRRLFIPSKGNLSKNPTGLAYTLMSRQIRTDNGLADSAYCSFSPDVIRTTAEELLAPKPVRKGTKKDTASDWLYEYLSEGPKNSQEIFNVGLQMGFSQRTLERAKSKLSIQSIRTDVPEKGTHKWEWSLPN